MDNAQDGMARASGALRAWHRVALDFEGPLRRENPETFRDFRLNVVFEEVRSGQRLTAPGYFAADGAAASSGARVGRTWRTIFAPPSDGTWRFRASFRTGADVALRLEPDAGRPHELIDGVEGRITVSPSDKSPPDLRCFGPAELDGDAAVFPRSGRRLSLRFAASTRLFGLSQSTSGAASAAQTDAMRPRRDLWRNDDPDWVGPADAEDGGRGAIGAVRAIAAARETAIWVAPIAFDEQRIAISPWAGSDAAPDAFADAATARSLGRCFSVARLERWALLLERLDAVGVAAFFALQPHGASGATAEHFSGDSFRLERKLFIRECAARFGHVNGLFWGAPGGVSEQGFLSALDPYNRPIAPVYATEGIGPASASGRASSKETGPHAAGDAPIAPRRLDSGFGAAAAPDDAPQPMFAPRPADAMRSSATVEPAAPASPVATTPRFAETSNVETSNAETSAVAHSEARPAETSDPDSAAPPGGRSRRKTFEAARRFRERIEAEQAAAQDDGAKPSGEGGAAADGASSEPMSAGQIGAPAPRAADASKKTFLVDDSQLIQSPRLFDLNRPDTPMMTAQGSADIDLALYWVSEATEGAAAESLDAARGVDIQRFLEPGATLMARFDGAERDYARSARLTLELDETPRSLSEPVRPFALFTTLSGWAEEILRHQQTGADSEARLWLAALDAAGDVVKEWPIAIRRPARPAPTPADQITDRLAAQLASLGSGPLRLAELSLIDPETDRAICTLKDGGFAQREHVVGRYLTVMARFDGAVADGLLAEAEFDGPHGRESRSDRILPMSAGGSCQFYDVALDDGVYQFRLWAGGEESSLKELATLTFEVG